jgi:hypothetical protein
MPLNTTLTPFLLQHFNRNMLDLSQAPVVVDSHVLSQLRRQLPSNKRCFTGEEFIGKVMEIGLGALAESVEDGDGSGHVQSPTGQYIEYNRDYASSVAQYLLEEGVLIHVSQLHYQSDGTPILEQTMEDSDSAHHIAGSYEERQLTDSLRPFGVNSAVSFTSGAQSAVSFASDATDSPRQGRQSQQSTRKGRVNSSVSQDTTYSSQVDYNYGRSSTRRLRAQNRHTDRPVFLAEPNVYYKFAGSEDEFFQSQILASSVRLRSRTDSIAGPSSDQQASRLSASNGSSQEFLLARMGTLCLVYDLLCQRARKERGAKQFLSSPRVQEHKRQAENVNCDLIFKM